MIVFCTWYKRCTWHDSCSALDNNGSAALVVSKSLNEYKAKSDKSSIYKTIDAMKAYSTDA